MVPEGTSIQKGDEVKKSSPAQRSKIPRIKRTNSVRRLATQRHKKMQDMKFDLY